MDDKNLDDSESDVQFSDDNSLNSDNCNSDTDYKETTDNNDDSFDHINAIKYIIELKVDKDKNSDMVRFLAYFIPEYKIEITIRQYQSHITLNYKGPIDVVECDKPSYIFKTENTILDREWVDQCYEFYKQKQKLNDFQNKIYLRAPHEKLKDEIINDLFNEGMICFESQNFKLGRKKFSQCLTILNGDKFDERYQLSCYNIACCYSRENKEQEALSWLLNAVSSGYTNWAHTITDNDWSNFLYSSHFIKIISLMMKANPKRSIVLPMIPTELNSIDIFLKENNIQDLEMKK